MRAISLAATARPRGQGRAAVVLPTALRWVTCRGYATKKDKQSKKEKAGKAATKATFNLDEAPIDLDRVKQGLEDIAANLKEDLAKFRPGKAGPALLDTIVLQMDGSDVPLNGVAQVSVRKGNTLIVSVFDPETAKAAMTALEASDLGLNPVLDGNEIRVPVPKMTAEYRKGLIKSSKDRCEAAKDKARSTRNKAVAQLRKKKAGVPEDDMRKMNDYITALGQAVNTEIDLMLEAKEKEISTA